MATEFSADVYLVIAALPHPVFLYAPGGIVAAVNPAAERIAGTSLAGCTAEEVIACLMVCHPNGTPLATCDLPASRALAGRVITDCRLRIRAADGTFYAILASASPILREGVFAGVLSSWSDITDLSEALDKEERRRSEAEALAEQLKVMGEALAQQNEELQRFAYVVSHDLQEPLRSIVGFSQLLDRHYRGRLDADADEYLGFIVEGGVRMEALIRDLLQVSQIGTRALQPAPTDAGVVVAASLRSLAIPIRLAGVEVMVDTLPVVMADSSQLEQVFTNLIGNALKYRRPDVPAVIRVSAGRDGDWWEFAVADNGIGIDAEFQDQIFEMFRRLHTQAEYDGTGIGLAIVRKIVEWHGGQVRVESIPGQGSTFFFTLPAV